MTHPIPTQTSQKPPMPWAKVWMEIAGLVPVEIFFIVLGAVAALVPTLFVWITNGAIEAGTLVFWCKWGMGLGAAIGGWFFWCSGLDIWREARGQRVIVDPKPFEQAAWAAFYAWLLQGGHRTAHDDGCATITFTVAWQIKNGDAVATYGPILEQAGEMLHSNFRKMPKAAWIPEDIAVPEKKERRAYSKQQKGDVAVRIGPFSVGTSHGLLTLEKIAASAAPRGPLL